VLSVERLRSELSEALPRLHDPALSPSEFLREVVGAGEAEAAAVQACILARIEELRPHATTPADSRPFREYELLRSRYVLGLTQEDTAECMRIGVRTVQRLQVQAIHALAVRFWRDYQQRSGKESGIASPPEDTSTTLPDWQMQARQELASLSATDPDAISDVQAVIADVLKDELILAHPQCLHVQTGFVQQGLETAIHPIALRQILIAIIRRLARCVTENKITIYARSEEGKARITLTGTVDAQMLTDRAALFSDIVAPDTVSLQLQHESDSVFLSVWLPFTGAVTVLVVDDNADMVQFYRRCTAATRYQLLHVSSAQAMFDALAQGLPDIIVLDVMLPDEDGWHVLMRLRENPETRSIPVMVVTVMREEELALSLGAAAYLTKPVPPQRFVTALDALAH